MYISLENSLTFIEIYCAVTLSKGFEILLLVSLFLINWSRKAQQGMWYHVRFSCTLVFTNHQFRFKTMQFGRKSNILYEVLVKAAHVFSGALWQRHCQLKSSISKEFYSRMNQLENNNNLDLTLKFLGSYRIQVEREAFVG